MMFENIVGHEDKKAYFKNIINNHNISHSYIFSGEDGIGKLTFAKEFTKGISNVENLESCPDYKYISKLEGKKDIIIEQIRKEIIDDIYIAPILGNYKVYIINEAQLLNIAAQNALLKTLEEPPKYIVVIMICSNVNKMLTTILSRSTKINFHGVDSLQIDNYIQKKFDISLPFNILEYVDGSIGKAINIINDKLIEKFRIVDKLVEFIQQKDVLNSMELACEIDFQNMNIMQYFEFNFYINGIYSSIKHIQRASLRLKNNGNYDIVIDNMILKIIDEI